MSQSKHIAPNVTGKSAARRRTFADRHASPDNDLIAESNLAYDKTALLHDNTINNIIKTLDIVTETRLNANVQRFCVEAVLQCSVVNVSLKVPRILAVYSCMAASSKLKERSH